MYSGEILSDRSWRPLFKCPCVIITETRYCIVLQMFSSFTNVYLAMEIWN